METPAIASLAISGLLALAIPLALIHLFSRKSKLPLAIASLGALFFVIVQVAHVPFVMLTQGPIYSFLITPLGKIGSTLVLAAYLGALASIFEEIARYLIFSRVIKEKTIDSAKLFGLGWGGIESIIFMTLLATGGTLLADFLLSSVDFSTYRDTLIAQGIDAQQAEATVQAMAAQKAALDSINPLLPFAGIYERMVAMAFHILASVLVMKSVIDHNRRGLCIALIAHFALDFAAVAASLSGNVLIIEGAVTLVVIGLAFATAKELKMNMRQLLPA